MDLQFFDDVLRLARFLGLGALFVVVSLAVAGGVWMGSPRACPCGAECPCKTLAKP